MKRIALFTTIAGLLLAAGPARAAAVVGQPAPEFTLTDSNGKSRSLASFKGKHVVLEWNNFDCPFVVKHYASGNMQKLQQAYAARGVVWLTVNSSAAGKQGHLQPAEVAAKLAERKAAASAYLLDADGTVGRLYGAKTTPHMFVIDPEGKLVYAGAIDDKPSTDQADIVGARNHVVAALDETLAGKPVSVASSTPYGCSVKY